MNRWGDCYSAERWLRHVRNERPAVKVAGVLAAMGYGLLLGYTVYMAVTL